jgi:hypothetical protein
MRVFRHIPFGVANHKVGFVLPMGGRQAEFPDDFMEFLSPYLKNIVLKALPRPAVHHPDYIREKFDFPPVPSSRQLGIRARRMHPAIVNGNMAPTHRGVQKLPGGFPNMPSVIFGNSTAIDRNILDPVLIRDDVNTPLELQSIPFSFHLRGF